MPMAAGWMRRNGLAGRRYGWKPGIYWGGGGRSGDRAAVPGLRDVGEWMGGGRWPAVAGLRWRPRVQAACGWRGGWNRVTRFRREGWTPSLSRRWPGGG